jgi:hypothetical protein
LETYCTPAGAVLGDGPQARRETMKTGTLIELHGTPAMGGFPMVAPERAKIARRTRKMGELPTGYHPVRFADGGSLLVHESRFRVIDNRI